MRRFADELMFIVGCKLDGLPPHVYERQAAEVRAILKDIKQRVKAHFVPFVIALFLVAAFLVSLVFFIVSTLP